MSNETHDRKPKRLWGLLGLLAIVAVALLIVRMVPSGQGPAGGGLADAGPGGAKSPASAPISRTAETAPAGAGSRGAGGTEDLALLKGIRDSVSADTYEALMARGFPAMRGPRKIVVEHTAKQSLEEVVADMGNVVSLMLCKDSIGEFSLSRAKINYWRGMTYHVKTLRVIEEGRRDPQRVVPLLERELAKVMASYKRGFGGGGSQTSVGIDDEYFAKHGRYEHSGAERLRRHEVVYASFYALACMDRLRSPDLLRQWVELQKWCEERKYLTVVCKDMSVWVIDKYFRQSGAGQAPEGQKFFELTKDAGAGPETGTRSRWNAPWEVNDFFLTATNTVVRDIPTIDVLEVPSDLRLDEAARDAAIDVFLKHAAGKVPPDTGSR